MIRIVAGKSSSGKSGYIMARFQINAMPLVSVPKTDAIPDGSIIHFPLMRQIDLKNGDRISTDKLLKSIKYQHPDTEVDFLYCGQRELCSRRQMRKHTEVNLTGYPTGTTDESENKVAYKQQLLSWLSRFRSLGFNVNLIHSHHGKYYVRSEAHFLRIVSTGESVFDHLVYFSRLHKPVAVRGWGLPLQAARSI